jgi:hypothetical protein
MVQLDYSCHRQKAQIEVIKNPTHIFVDVRQVHASSYVSNHVFVTGGKDTNGNILRDFWYYNTIDAGWHQMTIQKQARKQENA